MTTTLDRVSKIFADTLADENATVTGETSLRDHDDFDSLDLADFYMTVEEEFVVELPDSECRGFETVADVANRVDQLLAAQ